MSAAKTTSRAASPDAIEAAADVARAIAVYKTTDCLEGHVEALAVSFAELDSNLLRAAGLLVCDREIADHGEVAEAIGLLADVRSSLEWAIRRPLENAGVIAASGDVKRVVRT